MVLLNYNKICLVLAFFIPLSIQQDPSMIAFLARDNLYIAPIASSYDIATKPECPKQTMLDCMWKIFSDVGCLTSIFNDRLLDSQKVDIRSMEVVGKFMKRFKECADDKIKRHKLTHSALPLLTHESGGITKNLNPISVYPKCNQLFHDYLSAEKCAMKKQYNALDKIINECAGKGFEEAGIAASPAKPPIETYIDEMEDMATKKIGRRPLALATLPSEAAADTFGNLTYEELDAIKIHVALAPSLKQFLCDSKEDARVAAKSFSDVDSVFESSPQIPQNIENALQNFTPDIYEAVKAVLKTDPFLRWNFCSSIFAISSSKESINIHSVSAQPQALMWCRKLAEENDHQHFSICTRFLPRLN